MTDYFAIGTALAATMGTATLSTAPPIGGTAIRQATVIAPNNLTLWPALVVELPHTDSDVAVGNGWQDTSWDWDVYFILGRAVADDPRIRQTLLDWLGALMDSTYGSYQLGGVVDKAYVVSAVYEDYEYGGSMYPSWHLVTRTWNIGVPVTLTP
jgi:hypothetical protein